MSFKHKYVYKVSMHGTDYQYYKFNMRGPRPAQKHIVNKLFHTLEEALDYRDNYLYEHGIPLPPRPIDMTKLPMGSNPLFGQDS